jgi:hypothetical protein
MRFGASAHHATEGKTPDTTYVRRSNKTDDGAFRARFSDGSLACRAVPSRRR